MSIEHFLQELRMQYNNELDLRKNLDNKASSTIATSGTVTSLLFGFGTFILSRLKPDYTLIDYAIISLIVAILINIGSVILSILAFRLQKYKYAMTPERFFQTANYTEEEIEEGKNFNNKEINDFQTKPITEFQHDMILDYLECNIYNAKKNYSKAKWAILSQRIFLFSLVIIPIILAIIIHAFRTVGISLSP
jgi:hypothetical protein